MCPPAPVETAASAAFQHVLRAMNTYMVHEKSLPAQMEKSLKTVLMQYVRMCDKQRADAAACVSEWLQAVVRNTSLLRFTDQPGLAASVLTQLTCAHLQERLQRVQTASTPASMVMSGGADLPDDLCIESADMLDYVVECALVHEFNLLATTGAVTPERMGEAVRVTAQRMLALVLDNVDANVAAAVQMVTETDGRTHTLLAGVVAGAPMAAPVVITLDTLHANRANMCVRRPRGATQ
jgi:hypothetical protein